MGAGRHAAMQARDLSFGLGGRRERLERIRVDADGKLSGDQRAVEGADAIVERSPFEVVFEEAAKIADIGGSLEAENIELEQGLHQPVMHGDGEEQLGRRKRNMQEKADALRDAESAQFLR